MLPAIGVEPDMDGILVGKAMRGLCCVALVAVSLSLAGCKKSGIGDDLDPMTTASTSTSGPSFKRTEALSKQWKSDPTQVKVALAYANSLGELGQKPTQLQVLQTTASKTLSSADAQLELGKAILTAGDTVGATSTLERAVQLNPRDPHALSVLGAALDQQTKHGEARANYMKALALAPGDVSVMNNLAMSYSLQGKLPEAEATLRKAMAQPASSSNPRIRQNLALVVGLQGRFDEAKTIASEDLPPDQVEANMAYLQQMLASQNTWAKLKEG
jgi:Flp pilus assembly protein TadD